MSRVHVMYPPEESCLKHDERLCTAPDRDELVIFHCNSVITATGAWLCNCCGKHTGVKQ